MSGVEWNPQEFMDEQPVARLAQACMDSERVNLPDGTHITREDTGYVLRNRHGREMQTHTGTSKEAARSAAAHALDASAMSRHPKSIGGHRRFTSLQKARDNKPLDSRSAII